MPTHYDIFNGDADGICALHQLRLGEPKSEAQLITGVKRDIRLLASPHLEKCHNCTLTVLDVSLDSNRSDLERLLSNDNRIRYIDHHSADPIPKHPLLTSTINTSAEVCTSLLVNEILDGMFASWAVCGAFGDNLHSSADRLIRKYSTTDSDALKFREIGELLNYNGYGSSLEDLHFDPAELYRSVSHFEDPLIFFHEAEELSTLREGFKEDAERASSITEHPTKGKNRVFFFPDASWARRISGNFSNKQARSKPESAHALITHNPDGTLRISVRAPLADRKNADVLCKQFPGGGGRAAAAGINSLPETELDRFFQTFNKLYS
ncbi:acetyltransferase [Desulfopila sp. IMCC35008]|uniref:acetyltransferase n=1 Tax=Desulfopila sp. IMCC35008 TaxID=2653858 RepID=UPI0013D209FE|nr:acetyltransferase [Desulfopila sp. IMCC35008]